MTTARIVLTTGGTGGHIFPALAVAEALQRQCPRVELLFVGSEYGPEARLVAQAGIPFEGLPVRGVLGRGVRALGALAGMGRAVLQARSLLKEFRPDVVVGFGAYASAAPLVAAKMLAVPLALHEQNAVPGMVNKVLSRFAKRVFLSMPDVMGVFPAAKCELTGNPVRQGIMDAMRDAGTAISSGGSKRLLIMGGSQGARALNSVILGGLSRLLDNGVELWHQTGLADLERVVAGYRGHGADASNVTAFIDDMPKAYAWADLVLCRAGASSVAELAAAGKPSILIPFPFATHDHQTHNARVLVDAGAAFMVSEKELSQVDVVSTVLHLLGNATMLGRMGQAAQVCARPDAADRVARGLLAMVTKG